MSDTQGAEKPLVLITGAAGNIGSRLVGQLRQEYRVVGLDMPESAAEASFPCIGFDITQDESVEKALAQVAEEWGTEVAAVIHLAAYFDFSGEESPLYEQVNEQGTRRLLCALKQDFAVGRFVYSSTMLVHEPSEPGLPIDESTPLGPRWAYPKSKAATEAVIREEAGDAMPYTLLRLAGLYTDRGGVPTLVQQIQRIYERGVKSELFAGDPTHGQTFIHIEDVIEAIRLCVEKRRDLPRQGALLVGEPEVMSYEALQNQLGCLIHGEAWDTHRVPKPVAMAGAWVEDRLEPVIPDAIDHGERPFIKPFMVPMADDHYELDVSEARDQLGWQPEHSLRDTLPKIVAALKEDPPGWYAENGLTPPDWMEVAHRRDEDPEALRADFEDSYRTTHGRFIWAHMLNIGVGAWLACSPAISGTSDAWLAMSDLVSGIAVMILAAFSLSWRAGWARWATAGVGAWVLFAPLAFWAPQAAAYGNDTLVGALIIGLSVLSRPPPGVSMQAAMTGPDVPDGWEFTPSSWFQRIPIIVLAFVGLYISRYLAAYQLGHIDAVWEPFFAGSTTDPQNGTEEIITSKVSEAWPVPDAGVGALTYMLEILTGVIGGRRRWRTMPWLVMAFGIMIVPLGAISIFFIIIQPIVIGTWCTLCLVAAAAMLLQIPYSFDELVATAQFLHRRWKAGRPLLRVFLFGDTDTGGKAAEPDDFGQSPITIVKEMFSGGVNVPWNLALCLALGVWLMFTRLTLGTTGAMADADHLIGALVVTVTVTAFAEVARPLRFLNILLGAALLATPFMFAGAGALGSALSIVGGLALMALSLRRGPIRSTYGSWSRYLV